MHVVSSIDVQINTPGKFVTVTFRREPGFLEWSALMDSIFDSPSYSEGSSFLIDRRAAPIPQTKDVQAIMRYVDEKEARGETNGWALVVGDLGSFGMARMAQQLSDFENTIGVFKNVDDANVWLKIRACEPALSRQNLHAQMLPTAFER